MATSDRGFASTDKRTQNNVQTQGGKQAQASGQAHQFSAKEAQAAGKQGGQKNAQDKGHAAQHAQKGGKH